MYYSDTLINKFFGRETLLWIKQQKPKHTKNCQEPHETEQFDFVAKVKNNLFSWKSSQWICLLTVNPRRGCNVLKVHSLFFLIATWSPSALEPLSFCLQLVISFLSSLLENDLLCMTIKHSPKIVLQPIVVWSIIVIHDIISILLTQ